MHPPLLFKSFHVPVCAQGCACHIMHVEVKGQPWVSVLTFHLVCDGVSAYTTKMALEFLGTLLCLSPTGIPDVCGCAGITCILRVLPRSSHLHSEHFTL